MVIGKSWESCSIVRAMDGMGFWAICPDTLLVSSCLLVLNLSCATSILQQMVTGTIQPYDLEGPTEFCSWWTVLVVWWSSVVSWSVIPSLPWLSSIPEAAIQEVYYYLLKLAGSCSRILVSVMTLLLCLALLSCARWLAEVLITDWAASDPGTKSHTSM